MNRVYIEKSGLPTGVYYLVGLFTIPIIGILLYGLYQQIVLGQPFGNKSTSDTVLVYISIAVFTFCLLIFWILASLSIELKIADRKIIYRFPPFINRARTISISEVESWSVSTKSPLITGIGLRFDPIRKARIYSIGTSYFLIIKLNSGKSIMLSTKNPKEVEIALNSMEKLDHE